MKDLERARITEINSLHAENVAEAAKGIDRALRIGQLLTEQKSSMGHGAFGKWIDDNLTVTDRMARYYMKAYENRDRLKTETVSDMTIRALAAPEPVNVVEVKADDEAILRRHVRMYFPGFPLTVEWNGPEIMARAGDVWHEYVRIVKIFNAAILAGTDDLVLLIEWKSFVLQLGQWNAEMLFAIEAHIGELSTEGVRA